MLGPAHSVAHALDVLEPAAGRGHAGHEPQRQTSAPVAAALRDRNIPFVVVTGYPGQHREEPMFRDAPLLKKPCDGGELVRTLAGLLG